MFNKFSVGGFFLLLLLGCDGSSEVGGDVVKVADRAADQVASATAIYFPDGSGLDFKRKPISDMVLRNSKNKEYRNVRYEFDEQYEDIELAVASILKSSGYVRKISPGEAGVVDVYYSGKQKNTILFRYSSEAKDVGVKKTHLMVWWYL